MKEFFGKLAALTDDERRFAAEAWLLAPAVELSLAVIGLRRTIDAVERLTTHGTKTVVAISAERGAQLVAAAYRRHLVRGECLPRALIQYALHRRAGREVTLLVGVRKRNAAVAAHAWVEDAATPDLRSRQEGYEPILTRTSTSGRSAA